MLASIYAPGRFNRLQAFTMYHALSPTFLEYYNIRGDTEIPCSKTGVWPATYLAFAQADFREAKHARSLVNTISNAKRALHFQVENLSGALGWEKLKRDDSFQARLNFLNDCGVLSATTVHRVGRMNEVLPHDYYIPNEEEALEYLDLVEVTFGAVHETVTHFPASVEARLMIDSADYDASLAYPSCIWIDLPVAEGRLKIIFESRPIVDLSVNEADYFKWVAAIVRQNEACCE